MSRASSQLGVGDRRAAVAPKLHQPFGGELAQRMPHQRAAHPEALADGVLGQLGAGLQRLLDDGASQRLIDGAGAICTATGRLSRHVGAQVCMRALVAVSHLVGNLNRPILSCSIALSRAAR